MMKISRIKKNLYPWKILYGPIQCSRLEGYMVLSYTAVMKLECKWTLEIPEQNLESKYIC